MKNNYLQIIKIPFFGFILALASCSDIIQVDLEQTQVVTIAPADGATVNETAVNFIWQKNEDAERYHLKVVHPSFSDIQRVSLDTIVESTFLAVSYLEPDDYEWSVGAVNGVSETLNPTPHPFTLGVATNLTGLKPELTFPIDNVRLNNPTVRFEWRGFPATTEYQIQVEQTGGYTFNRTFSAPAQNPQFGYFDTVLPVSKREQFTWKVKALNSSSGTSSQYSDVKGFEMDTLTTN